MVDVSEITYIMRFKIKRERPSVTQGKELDKYKIEKENKK